MKSSTNISGFAFDLAAKSDLSLKPIAIFHPMITRGLELADLWFHLDPICPFLELQLFLKVLYSNFL